MIGGVVFLMTWGWLFSKLFDKPRKPRDPLGKRIPITDLLKE